MTDLLGNWSEIKASLEDHTCLWQDLEGLHLAPAPTKPPLTSILWAWPDGANFFADLQAPNTEETIRENVETQWAWTPPVVDFSPPLLWVRLDGIVGWVATLTRGWVTPVEPWGSLGQVDGLYIAPDSREPGESAAAAAARVRETGWCEVREPLPQDGSQPALFICPRGPQP